MNDAHSFAISIASVFSFAVTLGFSGRSPHGESCCPLRPAPY